MNNDHKQAALKNLKLGQKTEYCSEYAPELLQAVPRNLNRQELSLPKNQVFIGVDVWNAYELSWLNLKGKPVVALAQVSVNASSPNIIESKSFKLYLNSYNQTRFESPQKVVELMVKDLSAVAGVVVNVTLFGPSQNDAFKLTELPGTCIDSIDIEVDDFVLQSSLLAKDDNHHIVNETLHSHLLKSNCLITNQPDWASVVIRYKGAKIDHESLLRYLISFRMHNEFHEQCVERIFSDITNACAPESLYVQALYTRRGGLDINPCRYSSEFEEMPVLRINRQ